MRENWLRTLHPTPRSAPSEPAVAAPVRTTFALADGYLGTGARHNGEVLERRGQEVAAGRPEIIEPTAVLGFRANMLTPYHQKW